jgi:hypothetical protein
MHEIGKSWIGSDIVEARITVDPNHEEVLFIKRLLEILKYCSLAHPCCQRRRIIAHSGLEQKAEGRSRRQRAGGRLSLCLPRKGYASKPRTGAPARAARVGW